MATLAQWEGYSRAIAPLARWDVPDTAEGRDLLDRIRRKNDASAALGQALGLLRQGWGSFPAELRGRALEAVSDAVDSAIEGLADAGELADAAPLIGQIVGAVITMVQGFIKTGQAIKNENQEISNFAHQRAQFKTIAKLDQPWTWVYSPVTAKMYAQYIKVRTGGDFDVVPGFTRAGLERDRPFTGLASAPDSGNCRKAIKIGLDYVWDPASDCRRVLGISALFYPWWSGAYAPGPLPIWAEASGGTNANRLLIYRQTQLIADPRTNLRVPLAIVEKVRARVLAFWPRSRKVHPIDKDGNITGPGTLEIDAARNPKHVPVSGGKVRWYVDELDVLHPYPDQPGAELDRYGWPAPPGDPSNLGVTLAQRNTVVAMSAAFAARRQSTMRNGLLAAAILAELGPAKLDSEAVPALQYAAGQRRMLPMLEGPGAAPKRGLIGGGPPVRLQPAGEGDGGELAAAAILGALMFL